MVVKMSIMSSLVQQCTRVYLCSVRVHDVDLVDAFSPLNRKLTILGNFFDHAQAMLKAGRFRVSGKNGLEGRTKLSRCGVYERMWECGCSCKKLKRAKNYDELLQRNSAIKRDLQKAIELCKHHPRWKKLTWPSLV